MCVGGKSRECNDISPICDNSVTTQECHNSKCLIFQERLLKVLKCYNFLWVQRRHNCSPAASFANCVMTLYLLKVHLQTLLSIPITQKCQILSCDILVANERYTGGAKSHWAPILQKIEPALVVTSSSVSVSDCRCASASTWVSLPTVVVT